MDTEKIESLHKIADRHRLIHDQRRLYEYKILILAFSLIVSTTYFSISGKIDASHNICWFIALGIISFSATVGLYISRLHRANARNMTVAENCETRILEIIEEIKVIPSTMRNMRQMDDVKNNLSIDSNWFWQMIILVMSSFIASFIIIGHTLTNQ